MANFKVLFCLSGKESARWPKKPMDQALEKLQGRNSLIERAWETLSPNFVSLKVVISILLTYFFSGLSSAQLSPAQETYIDSLKEIVTTSKQDTSVINAWISWDNMIYFIDPELDFILNQKIDSLSKLNLEKSLSKKKKNFFLKWF